MTKLTYTENDRTKWKCDVVLDSKLSHFTTVYDPNSMYKTYTKEWIQTLKIKNVQRERKEGKLLYDTVA